MILKQCLFSITIILYINIEIEIVIKSENCFNLKNPVFKVDRLCVIWRLFAKQGVYIKDYKKCLLISNPKNGFLIAILMYSILYLYGIEPCI